jgi:hypothetical protein
MRDSTTIALVQQWQGAANRQDIPLLLALSDPEIELVGPRGVAHGHAALAEWAQRAGAQLMTWRIFARGDRAAAAQHGMWRSPETGEAAGEADVATSFLVREGRVIRVARYDALDQALCDAQVTMADEQAL